MCTHSILTTFQLWDLSLVKLEWPAGPRAACLFFSLEEADVGSDDHVSGALACFIRNNLVREGGGVTPTFFAGEETEVQGGKAGCAQGAAGEAGYSQHSDPRLWDSRGYAPFHFFLGKHSFLLIEIMSYYFKKTAKCIDKYKSLTNSSLRNSHLYVLSLPV